MAKSRQALRSRMQAIENTKKITGAMQMLAVNKFSRNLNYLRTNLEHTELIEETVQKILWAIEEMDEVYLHENDVERKAIIVFTSDVGLCGSYNQNIFQVIQEETSDTDTLIVIGKKGHHWLTERGYEVANPLVGIEEVSEDQLQQITSRAIEAFVAENVRCVKLIYTEYVNPMVNEVKTMTLLPLTREESIENQREILFEPSEKETLRYLIPFYLDTVIYSCLREAVVAEQASRRLSMDQATDNADNLLETLRRHYQKTRQAQITQEVNEIVGGSGFGEGR